MGLYAYGKKWAYAHNYSAALTWYQKLAKGYFHWYRDTIQDVRRKSYLDDDIEEALWDASSDGEGRISSYYLRYHLKKRHMFILTWQAITCIVLLSVAVGISTILILLGAQ